MVRQGKRSPNPAREPSHKKKITPVTANISARKRPPEPADSSTPRPAKSPHLSGQKIGLTKIKVSTEPPEAPYTDRILPLIERGRAAKSAQKKATANNVKNKTLRRERFIKIFREEEAATGSLSSKEGLLKSAIEKFTLLYGPISERTAWSYLRGSN